MIMVEYENDEIIRCMRDRDSGSILWFCIEDFVDILIPRQRNRTRALQFLKENYDHEMEYDDDDDDDDISFLHYKLLKKVISILKSKHFFSESSFVTFLQWYEKNRPTVVNNSEEEEEEEEDSEAREERKRNRKEWMKFVVDRKKGKGKEEEEEESFQEDFQYLSEEQEEEREKLDYRLEQLSPKELKLRCTILESLSKTFSQLPAGSLKDRLLVSITNLINVIDYNMPLYEEDNSPVVRVTRRIQQLRPRISLVDIRANRLEIGELASDKYYEVYGIRPPQFRGWVNGQIRNINKYTEKTSSLTLDVVIKNFEF